MAAPLHAVLCHDGGRERRPERTDGGTGRQVLVAGGGLAAAVTAGFLDHAGLDPVLAPSANESATPPVAVVWRPGLALLERLGLCRPVVRRGRTLVTLDRLTTGESWRADDDGRPALVAIDRPTLRDLLDTHVLDRVRTTERAVTAVESTPTGVRATFERGVAEPFDAAVTADPSAGPEPATTGTVHAWTFEWPADRPAPDGPAEAWDGTRAAFAVPASDATHVHLVATGETSAATAVSPDGIADRFGHLFAATAAPFPALDRDGFAYRRVSNVAPLSLSRGHVARIGPAARVALTGSHLGPAIDIEAAWTLADALAYGPASVEAALAAYERRRRQRAARLWAHRSATAEPERPLSPPLRQLWVARRLAFSHVVGSQPALARDVPESL